MMIPHEILFRKKSCIVILGTPKRNLIHGLIMNIMTLFFFKWTNKIKIRLTMARLRRPIMIKNSIKWSKITVKISGIKIDSEKLQKLLSPKLKLYSLIGIIVETTN